MGGQDRQQVGDLDAADDLTVAVPAQQVDGGALGGRAEALEAASLVGCASATVRAAQSPTTTCAGAASAAIVNGITSPMRW